MKLFLRASTRSDSIDVFVIDSIDSICYSIRSVLDFRLIEHIRGKSEGAKAARNS